MPQALLSPFSNSGIGVIGLLLGFAALLVPAHGDDHFDDAPLTRFRRQARELLRQEAIAPAGTEKDAAVAALCDLYVVARSSEQYATSKMLREDAAKIRRRLLTVSKRRKEALQRAKVERPDNLNREVDTAMTSAVAAKTSMSELLASTIDGGNGGGALDQGWQLVELIQRVVSPDFWDSLGGPGTIRYFAMRRVLVVRATSDVHQQLKDLLIALR